MYKNVLVALDLETNHEHVFKKALKLAIENKANLIIAYVETISVAGISIDSSYVMTPNQNVQKEDMLILEGLLEKANLYVNATLCVELGLNVASLIVDKICLKNDVDLIVCGSSNTHGVSSLILGSVSSKLVKYSRCDVFVIKDKIK